MFARLSLLLTTLAVPTLQQASQTLAWYTQRRGIEVTVNPASKRSGAAYSN